MATINRIEVIDKEGWRKAYTLQRSICLIGSTTGNDLVLDSKHGRGVEPRHLQLIQLPNQGYQLINLSDKPLTLDETSGQTLESRGAMNVYGGQRLVLGDFTLIFHGGSGGGLAPAGAAATPAGAAPAYAGTMGAGAGVGAQASDYIGLELLMPQTTLAPGQAIDGAIIIRNQGDTPGVKFKIMVEGMPEGSYHVAPGPVLFPNAEKKLPFRLHHPKETSLVSGTHQLKIHVTAPEAYPREQATAAVAIQILPYYQHTLSLERIT